MSFLDDLEATLPVATPGRNGASATITPRKKRSILDEIEDALPISPPPIGPPAPGEGMPKPARVTLPESTLPTATALPSSTVVATPAKPAPPITSIGTPQVTVKPLPRPTGPPSTATATGVTFPLATPPVTGEGIGQGTTPSVTTFTTPPTRRVRTMGPGIDPKTGIPLPGNDEYGLPIGQKVAGVVNKQPPMYHEERTTEPSASEILEQSAGQIIPSTIRTLGQAAQFMGERMSRAQPDMPIPTVASAFAKPVMAAGKAVESLAGPEMDPEAVPKRLQKDLLDDPSLLLDPKWYALYAPQAAGSMATFLLAGMVGGPLLAAATESLMEAGNTYASVRDATGDESQAGDAAAVSFATNLAITYPEGLLFFAKGSPTKLLERLPTKIRNLIAVADESRAGRTLTRATAEGAQEVGQEKLADVAERPYIPDRPKPQYGTVGAMGAFMGGGAAVGMRPAGMTIDQQRAALAQTRTTDTGPEATGPIPITTPPAPVEHGPPVARGSIESLARANLLIRAEARAAEAQALEAEAKANAKIAELQAERQAAAESASETSSSQVPREAPAQQSRTEPTAPKSLFQSFLERKGVSWEAYQADASTPEHRALLDEYQGRKPKPQAATGTPQETTEAKARPGTETTPTSEQDAPEPEAESAFPEVAPTDLRARARDIRRRLKAGQKGYVPQVTEGGETPGSYLTAAGGVRFDRSIRGELQDMPKSRRKYINPNGTGADILVDRMRTDHPEWGIETESDLIDLLREGGDRLTRSGGDFGEEEALRREAERTGNELDMMGPKELREELARVQEQIKGGRISLEYNPRRGPVSQEDRDSNKRRNLGAESGNKAVDENGNPLALYHGAQRSDRIGNRFMKSRATSGPMPFFTNDPEIASRYAMSKKDTSLEPPEDYAGWFKFKPQGSRTTVDIDQAWHYLTSEQKAEISDKLPHVVNLLRDESGNEIEIDGYQIDPKNYGLAGKDHWDGEIRRAHGNVLKAAAEIWLSGGTLVNSEEDFMQILRLGGMKDVEFDSPWREQPGVFPVHIYARNPLDTHSVPPEVVDALQRRANRQRGPRAKYGTDSWDKDMVSPQDWMQSLKDDIEIGKNSNVWTSIPDWVTNELQRIGYDSIHDKGGKNSYNDHDVWIPFEESQVKSATGNRGTYDTTKKSILDYNPRVGEEVLVDGQRRTVMSVTEDDAVVWNPENGKVDVVPRSTTRKVPEKPRPRVAGSDAILERIAQRVRQEKLDPDIGDAARAFVISLQDTGYLDDLGISIRAGIPEGPQGRYQAEVEATGRRSDAVVSIFYDAATDPRVGIHEISHHLEQFVPDADLDPLRARYETEKAAYEKRKSVMSTLGRAGRGEFTAEGGYRYKSFGEYFAERMADLELVRQGRMKVEADASVWIKPALQLKHLLQEWWDAVKAHLSGDVARRIYRNLQLGRYGIDEEGPTYRRPSVARYEADATPAEPFYSNIRRTVEAKMGGSAEHGALASMLQNSPGVKPEELEDTGILDWLFRQEGKVRKEDVLRYLDENTVKVEIKEHDMTGKTMTPFQEGVVAGPYETQEAAEADAIEAFPGEDYQIEEDGMGFYVIAPAVYEEGGVPAERQLRYPLYTHGDYWTPGGENHREMLLTLPQREAALKENSIRSDLTIVESPGESRPYHILSGGEIIYKGESRERAERVLEDSVRRRLEEWKRKEPERTFKSPHFDEPNILAHLRLADYEGPSGERVLLVDEAQSDWHGAARRVRANEIDRLVQEQGMKLKDAARRVPENFGYKKDTPVSGGPGIPDAPYKRTWHERAMREAIRFAAQNGYDRIAWVTGEQTAERYNLAKQVKHIAWEKNDDGTYNINAPLLDGSPGIYKEELSPKELVDTIGKDVAARIQNDEGRPDKESPYRAWKILEGDDLKIGVEWAFALYDRAISRFMADNAKKQKWGSAPEDFKLKPGKNLQIKIEINRQAIPGMGLSGVGFNDNGERFVVIDQNRDLRDAQFASRAEAEEYIENYKNNSTVVHSIALTPDARDAVLYRGQPSYYDPKDDSEILPAGMGYRGRATGGVGFGATEGEGYYIAKNKGLAKFFSGKNGDLYLVRYREPKSPLVVDNEELPILSESEILFEPIHKSDSEWITANKEAVIKSGVTDKNWDNNSQDKIAHELTAILKRRGYDAVHVKSGGEEWVVLLSSSEELWNQILDEQKVTFDYNPQDRKANLARFMEGSKVVDADGKPLVVYHGTAKDFDVFDTTPATKRPQTIESSFLGSFFTKEKTLAEGYARWAGGERVVPVYLSIRNPKRLTPTEHEYINTKGKALALRNRLESQGYDGIIFLSKSGPYGESLIDDEFVVFSPTQIKSATGNRGTFDATRPSILDYNPQDEGEASPPPGQGERQGPKTMEESGRFGGFDLLYDKRSNARDVDSARKRIEADPAAAYVYATDYIGAPNPEQFFTQLGLADLYGQQWHRLTDEGRAAGDAVGTGKLKLAAEIAQRQIDMTARIARDGTTEAQALQARSRIKDLSPTGVLIWAQREINRINREAGKEVRAPLSAEEAAKMQEQASKAQEWSGLGDRAQEIARLSAKVFSGQPMTPEEWKQVRDLTRQIQVSIPKRKVAPKLNLKTLGYAANWKDRETPIRDKAPRAPAAPRARTVAERVVERFSEAEAAARERLKAKGWQIQAGIDPESLKDLAIIGASKLAKSGISFTQWSSAMVKDFGDGIQEHLRDVFDQSRKVYKQARDLELLANRALAKIQDAEEDVDRTAPATKVQALAKAYDALTAASEGQSQEDAAREVRAALHDLGKNPEPTPADRQAKALATLMNTAQEALRDAEEDVDRPISAKDAKTLQKAVERLQGMTGAQADEAAAEVAFLIGALKKPTGGQKVATIQVMSQLSGTKTWATRNPLGNEIRYRFDRMSLALPTLVDYGRSKMTGSDRTVTMSTGGAQRTFFHSLLEGARLSWKGLPVGAEKARLGGTGQYEVLPGFRFQGPGWTQQAVEKISGKKFDADINIPNIFERITGVTLRAMDHASYQRAYMGSLGHQASLDAVNLKIPQDARRAWIANRIHELNGTINEMARDYAERMTYANENMLTEGASGLKRSLNLLSSPITRTKDWGLGNLLLNFTKVPTNLVIVGIENSPLGIATSLFKLSAAAKAKDHSGFSKALGAGLLGTIPFYLGYFLMKHGALVGADDKDLDADAKAVLREQLGISTYQANISGIMRWAGSRFQDTSLLKTQDGDTFYTYDWAQPIAFAVQMGAELGRTPEDRSASRTFFDVLVSGPKSVAAGLQTVLVQPLIRGLIDFSKRIGPDGNIAGAIEQTAYDIPSTFTPSILNQAKQLTDNLGRVTHDPSPWIRGMNRALYRLPIFSKTLPVAYKTLGKDMPREIYQDGRNTLWHVLLDPGWATTYHADTQVDMLFRPYEQAGEKKQFPDVPRPKLTFSSRTMNDALKNNRFKGPVKIVLTGKEFSEWQRINAVTFTDELNAVPMARLNRMSPEDLADLLSDAKAKGKRKAREWFIKNVLMPVHQNDEAIKDAINPPRAPGARPFTPRASTIQILSRANAA